eukprot:10200593-Ditylum_brightwellii.AAC.1
MPKSVAPKVSMLRISADEEQYPEEQTGDYDRIRSSTSNSMKQHFWKCCKDICRDLQPQH